MRRILLIACLFAPAMAFAGDWWAMPTICQPSTATCYASMGAGFDENEWDTQARCRGKKLICPNAILPVGSASFPEPFSKAEISDPSKINADFDVLAFNAGCFGMRKTRNNGTEARVGSDWVNVYCAGVLTDPDESLATGEIMLSAADRPTCKTLAPDGFIGVLNGACYGKYDVPPNDFFLECIGNELLPSKIVILNGANNTNSGIATSMNPNAGGYPTDEAEANAVFNKWASAAAAKRDSN